MDIKRYDFCGKSEIDPSAYAESYEEPDGSHVLFTDHKAVVEAKDAEIEELGILFANMLQDYTKQVEAVNYWKALHQSIAEQVRERLLNLRWQSVYSEMQSPRVMNLAEYVEAIRTADLSDITGEKS